MKTIFLLLILILLPCQSKPTTLTVSSSSGTSHVNLEHSTYTSYAVGKNGYLSIGTQDSDWLNGVIANVPAIGGTLGLYSRLELSGDGSIILNPSLIDPGTPAPHNLVFARNSLFVVNGRSAPYTSNGAIFSGSDATATVQPGARLMVTQVSAGRTYRILGENIHATYPDNSGWHNRYALTDSHVLGLEERSDMPGYFRVINIPAQDAYPPLDDEIGGIIDDNFKPEPPHAPQEPEHPDGVLPAPGEIISGNSTASATLGTEPDHFNSAYGGVRFLSRVTSTRYMDHDYTGTMTTLESATRIAIIGAVPQMLLAISNAQTKPMERRISRRNLPLEMLATNQKENFALWIAPFFRASNGFDLHANNFSFDFYGRLGGLSAGCDWTTGDNFRLGASLTAGGGYIKSGGDLADTTNNLSFWGAGLYGAWFKGDFSLGMDATFTDTLNSLTQELPKSLEMRDLSAELTARSISVGLNLEYDFTFGNVHLTPHAGSRMIYAHTDPYTVYSNGPVMDGSSIDQTVWLFPTGISANAEFQTEGGWRLAPLLDLSIIPAAGDIEARTKVFYTGTYTPAAVHTQTRDYLTVAGTLGMEAARGPISFSLGLMFEGGLRTSNQEVQASFRYEF